MPRRNWGKPSETTTNQHLQNYVCPPQCPGHARITDLFGLVTYELAKERRITNRAPVPSKSMVNGVQMRGMISDLLVYLRDGILSGELQKWPILYKEYNNNQDEFIGLVLGCICDLCFNIEYIRRIQDRGWTYCNKHEGPKAFYPYLGICPQCILTVDTPSKAAFHSNRRVAVKTEENAESGAQYFGNKIQSHHVGRIGERIFAFILDIIAKSTDPNAETGLVIDDQHDIDAVVISQGIMTLIQIKSSPLILLPAVVLLPQLLVEGTAEETGLPLPKPSHTFTDIIVAALEIGLYMPLTNTQIPLGKKTGNDWPYDTFRKQLNVSTTLSLLNNWFLIFRSFEIPKRNRKGDDVRRAYLTCGWGAPIDDNKAKPGLARSDNMMKGTYASLKYGAYYSTECMNRTIRAGLFANVDPVHQYEDYLAKLEDIRWGHKGDFHELKSEGSDYVAHQIIDSNKLIYLFDSVFTFNRRILNDSDTRRIWSLQSFMTNLLSGQLDNVLSTWRQD